MNESIIQSDLSKQILEKLAKIEESSQKGWLSTLTEQSSILLNTEEIALLTGHSYHHAYKEIVSHPDFPSPVKITNKTKPTRRAPARRWIAGEVIRYLRNKSMN
ncbi:hypothetical protein LVJ82_17150 [Vitreoscilla massiliensis]|uniref:Transcriptional regulator n=1 Tax=Vitreoscilla massiliensis TaxID=1689272 RepID=A0ABY4E0T9_9NEIS|nr:hypothetical protein [Vitreoscilla massiliensis]UOO89147.1 hypothetical protein LVJ82_17150 [Vitreoscilla massiliensis]